LGDGGEGKSVKRKREGGKETYDHSNVLNSAWLNAACGLRRARFRPVRNVCVILHRALLMRPCIVCMVSG
jgi:hypothetical protein